MSLACREDFCKKCILDVCTRYWHLAAVFRMIIDDFLSRFSMLCMHNAILFIANLLVCPKNTTIVSNCTYCQTFPLSDRGMTIVFEHYCRCKIPSELPQQRRLSIRRWENLRFSTEIAVYLVNGTSLRDRPMGD